MAIEVAPPELYSPDARKRRRERRLLWNLGVWGGSAVLALTALAITSNTENGSARLQSIVARISRPEPAIAMASVAQQAAEAEATTKRLEAQVLALAADRDRLSRRLVFLERNIDDVTGSIKREAALVTAALLEKSVAPAPSAPAPSATPPMIAPLAMPAIANTGAWPGTPPLQTATPAPEAVPMPPTKLSAALASEAAAEPPPPRKAELGIDLGGAHNMEVLGARWAAVKANFGPLLTGLRPLVAHDKRGGTADYRLLVGPLPNAAAAARLCAHFSAARVTCRQAKFDGEQIAQR
jgi:hypothetical protein